MRALALTLDGCGPMWSRCLAGASSVALWAKGCKHGSVRIDVMVTMDWMAMVVLLTIKSDVSAVSKGRQAGVGCVARGPFKESGG